MHELCGIFYRMQDPSAQEEEDTRKDDFLSDRADSPSGQSPTADGSGPFHAPPGNGLYNGERGMPVTTLSELQAAQQVSNDGSMIPFMKPKFARAPIKEAGRVAYLGESSNLSLLVHDWHGTTDVVHYPLPDTVKGSRARLTELDNVEIDILHQRGAFLLPPRALCDELVDSFFKWVAPVVPVINRSRFMRRYRDNKNPPSLLLLQAILLAGSRVCTNTQLMDANGSTTPAAMTFYKRAKALYDANYEDDRVTIVQALILMGWYWEGPEGKYSDRAALANARPSNIASDVTRNVFYWSRVATIVAQGVEGSQLSRADKRLWKRIWWTLFTRDRSVAVALGRPVHINTDDSDVEMISEDDFIEDETDTKAEFAPDHVHVQFFLQYVRLCEIMGLVLSQQYSVASKARRQNAIDLTHSDMALADWLQNCAKEVTWEKSRHHFCTTLCLLHRAHMPPATAHSNGLPHGYPEDAAYPSRTIAFQAAAMITSIVESLQAHDQLKFTPAFIVYSLFSALIMHVYQMRSSNPSVVSATQERMRVCMDALKEVSKVWLVAKMVHTLFLSILGNKVLEEKLQKAPGKRHKKMKVDQPLQPADQPKLNYDDATYGYTHGGPPAPAVSYERSRPQTPAVTPSRDLGQQASSSSMPAPPILSPHMRHAGDPSSLFPSRGNTRPTTPFNASYSVPATPPDFYLVTRNSPPISQSLWENFQPDQLFPESTNMAFPVQYSLGATNHHQQNLDPQLHMPQMPQAPVLPPHGMQAHLPQRGMRGTTGDAQMGMGLGLPQEQQQQQQAAWANQLSPEDSWSNSSRGQQMPVAPATLNVEDW
ncbi:Transcriptional activator of fatty acid utilization [Xylographa carneopallida]|nr:Transcriptional activator of fatty acid utilization [Xylographa carneopallida]